VGAPSEPRLSPASSPKLDAGTLGPQWANKGHGSAPRAKAAWIAGGVMALLLIVGLGLIVGRRRATAHRTTADARIEPSTQPIGLVAGATTNSAPTASATVSQMGAQTVETSGPSAGLPDTSEASRVPAKPTGRAVPRPSGSVINTKPVTKP